jgi:HEAT repeat protein
MGIFDSQPYVRATAAEALGKIGGATAEQFLLSKCRDLIALPDADPLILYTLIEALGGIGAEAVYKDLFDILPTTKGKLRNAVLHALVRIMERCGSDAELPELPRNDLLGALRDENPDVQVSAVKGLGRFSDDETTAVLLGAMTLSDAVCSAVSPVLERRQRVIPVLVEVLESHRLATTKEILSLLGRLISRIRYPDIPEEFMRKDGLLQRAVNVVKESWGEANAETRAAAIDAMFRLDGDQAIEFLDAIAKESDPAIRTHVIELLSQLDDPRIPEFVSRFLNDEDEMVRELAASSLEMRGAQIGWNE